MSPGALFGTGKSAVLSPCGRYRYALRRVRGSDPGPTLVNFVMLNPSTADAEDDDPTVRRCLRFARDWGYGGLVVTNLFAWRATDPRELSRAADPVGPDNDRHLAREAASAALVVCAWGAVGQGRWQRRVRAVVALLRAVAPLHAVRLTRGGDPGHPLFLPARLTPIRWEAPR